MIVELYKYLTNPATSSAKKLGQLKETIAMEARYHRSKKQWQTHLDHSKETIKSAAADISKAQDAIVLGSGLLLDIPIDFLSAHFQHVYLVDVVHLKKVRKHIKKFNNVTLVEHDVTGLGDALLKSKKMEMEFQHDSKIPCLTENTGLVVSANMLSQIHLAPIHYAEKELKFNENKLETLAHNIMKNHITMLKNTKCKVCLITDYKRFYQDKDQQTLNEENVLIDIELPKPEKIWRWEIAPLGELNSDTSMSSLVYAYNDFS